MSLIKKIFNRKMAGNLLVTFVSSLICLLLLEVAMRILYPAYSPSGRIPYTLIENGVPVVSPNTICRQWRNKGEFDVEIKINQYGFRDVKDFKLSRKEDIFVLGDSYSFGHGVEEDERYSNLFQSQIDSDVYNIAIPANLLGYKKHLEYAKQNGANVGNIILGLCMENDLLFYNEKTLSPASHLKKRFSFIAKVKRYLTNHSCLYSFITAHIHQNRAFSSFLNRLGLIKENEIGALKNVFAKEILSSTVNLLDDITQNYNSIVVIIPSRLNWVGDNQEEEQKIHRTLISLLNENNINVLDLKPIFEASGDPMQFHFEYDGHWNKNGHRLAAKAITLHWLKQEVESGLIISKE